MAIRLLTPIDIYNHVYCLNSEIDTDWKPEEITELSARFVDTFGEVGQFELPDNIETI